LPINIDAMMPHNSAGWSVATFGPGDDTLDDHRADHQGHCRVRWNAKRQQRDETARRARVIGGFGTGDTFDRALAELFRRFRHPLFHRVGRECREDCPAAWQDAKRGPPSGAPPHGRDHRLQVRARRPERPKFHGQDRPVLVPFQTSQDLGDADEADSQGHET
jgi:hypothetical protein